MNSPTRPDSIVLVHGLWMTPRSWENWVATTKPTGAREARQDDARYSEPSDRLAAL